MILRSRLLIISFMACLFTSCTPGPANTNTAIVQPTPAPSASLSPSPSPAEPKTASVQVTLPLLDALLTDEKFVSQIGRAHV